TRHGCIVIRLVVRVRLIVVVAVGMVVPGAAGARPARRPTGAVCGLSTAGLARVATAAVAQRSQPVGHQRTRLLRPGRAGPQVGEEAPCPPGEVADRIGHRRDGGTARSGATGERPERLALAQPDTEETTMAVATETSL